LYPCIRSPCSYNALDSSKSVSAGCEDEDGGGIARALTSLLATFSLPSSLDKHKDKDEDDDDGKKHPSSKTPPLVVDALAELVLLSRLRTDAATATLDCDATDEIIALLFL
jgi:hypothetical protein